MNFDVKIFSAETILNGAPILDQINSIKSTLVYKTENGNISIDDYYTNLCSLIGQVKSFDLRPQIPSGGEYAYLLEVTNSLQSVLDEIEMISVKAVFFQARLKSIQKNIDNAASTFSAWYQIALSHALKENDIKIPVSAVKSLGDSEFSRLMDGHDLNIEAMIQSMDIQIGLLKSNKNLCQDKYKMAKEQVNASISNLAPTSEFGNEQVRLPAYRKLIDKYGDHFKSPGKLTQTPPPEEEDDDTPVIFNRRPTEEDQREEAPAAQTHVVPDLEEEEAPENVAVSGIVKRTIQEVKPLVVEDPFAGTLSMEGGKAEKIHGKKLVPAEDDDDEPVLFQRNPKKDKSKEVTKDEVKPESKPEPKPEKKVVPAEEEDDDTPVLFKKSSIKAVDVSAVTNPTDPAAKMKVSEEPDEVVLFKKPGSKVVEPSDDDDEFPAIREAQEQFQVKNVAKPAKNIVEKPSFNDDDLDDIM